MHESAPLLAPEWPAPANIRACTTLAGKEGHFDLRTAANRALLKTLATLPREPAWMNQTHSTIAIRAYTSDKADASYTDQSGEVCVVMTADCLPVLLCHQDGSKIAAIHAGWRGLAGGILEKTVNTAGFEAKQTLAWLGPAIGPDVFEVGDEVREQFLAQRPENANAFKPSPKGRWLADLYALATLQLHQSGIRQIFGGGHCTFRESDLFFSYRREKEAGRMATLIWMV